MLVFRTEQTLIADNAPTFVLDATLTLMMAITAITEDRKKKLVFQMDFFHILHYTFTSKKVKVIEKPE